MDKAKLITMLSKMKNFKIGETVNHVSMLGPITILAKIRIESTESFIDNMYRCRCFDGRITDFFDFELKPRNRPEE